MDPREAREKAVRDAKAGLILDAALKVFAQSGYHSTRLEDIAGAAGFSKASLYNYYDSKEAIFLCLAIREYERLCEKLGARLDPRKPLVANIEVILRTVFELFGEHFALLLEISDVRAMSGLQLESLAKQHDALMMDFRHWVREMQDLFVTILSAARERGELESPLDDEVLAAYIGAQLRGVLFDWKIAGRKGDIDTSVRQALEFVLHGVRGKG
ncbi:MAG: TetR family transcriptional regulator [Chitinivibrionales bacterium]|nr:TetR family transcriptional regulator [Chitinivibrionales bacterium]